VQSVGGAAIKTLSAQSNLSRSIAAAFMPRATLDLAPCRNAPISGSFIDNSFPGPLILHRGTPAMLRLRDMPLPQELAEDPRNAPSKETFSG
jgi:hypothetical protein